MRTDLSPEFKKWLLQLSNKGYKNWCSEIKIDDTFSKIKERYQESFGEEDVFVVDLNNIDNEIKKLQDNLKINSGSFNDYSKELGNGMPKAILNKHFVNFIQWYGKSIIFKDISELTSLTNNALGEKWCGEFQQKRKELAGKSRSAARDVLFKDYSNSDRDWVINEGGGIEVQYHLAVKDDNTIKYGIGFNTQYVPFANDMTMIEYVEPYMKAFLNTKSICDISMYGCDYLYGSEDTLRSPQKEQYTLYGKSVALNTEGDGYVVSKLDFEMMISNLKTWLFVYETIFEERNRVINDRETKIETKMMTNYTELLFAAKNIIFTGAPGTGKTFLAHQIADKITNNKSFVQFHPSYDYTDFIEGLRPIDRNGVIGFQRQNGTFKSFCERAIAEPEQKFVFIIDEINRGEISKIFGELFFSVDPGYRGTKGVVQTQYQNLINENDTFYNGFYIPENVYIIGTMNDIDRSVECMDFAMRRRFTWIEVTADSRVEMFGSTDWADEAIKRMQSMNKVIEDVAGLNQSYHVGPAYFLKLETYSGTDKWDKLWCYHLEPLINEYLRGMPDAKTDLEKIKNAYDLKTTNNTNDGQ